LLVLAAKKIPTGIFLQNVQSSSGVQPGSCSMGTYVSPGVKWLGFDVNRSPPSGAVVKNEGSYTCTLLIAMLS